MSAAFRIKVCSDLLLMALSFATSGASDLSRLGLIDSMSVSSSWRAELELGDRYCIQNQKRALAL